MARAVCNLLCGRFRSLVTERTWHISTFRLCTTSCRPDNANHKTEDVKADTKKESLDELSQQVYDELRAVFPYQCLWKLSAKETVLLNNKNKYAKIEMLNLRSRHEHEDLRMATKKAAKRKKDENREKHEVDHRKMFLFLRPKDYRLWYSNQLRHVYMFGPELIFDCGYEKSILGKPLLRYSYISSFTKLLLANRTTSTPYKIWLCNLSEDSPLRELISGKLSDGHPHDFISMTSKSYLDIFDKDELVYLSGDSRKKMKSFDPSAVYIIGGLPDRGGEMKQESMVKARKENLKCLQIPVGDFVRVQGSTSNMPMHRVYMLFEKARTASYKEAIACATHALLRGDVDKERVVSSEASKRDKKAYNELQWRPPVRNSRSKKYSHKP